MVYIMDCLPKLLWILVLMSGDMAVGSLSSLASLSAQTKEVNARRGVFLEKQ
ncbi:hypothetical protein [Shimia sagamensis]|uniref:Uncharacterized protein n=1 Tax=Shimia sagamensis TaxID=1566352 RepID=A0ABY1PHK6_9RHOB|nr:hypothetical protein [Shimia sagamensis]SMP33044.1 hypothetical protein SAMN06265373_1099 [Shimia sagamensis]